MSAVGPRILVLSMEPPRMPGSGGEVRSYYFVKALANSGPVTIVSLGAGENRRVAPDLIQVCKRVVQPPPNEEGALKSKPLRFAAWMRTLLVLAWPGRHGWADFLSYCLQHCPLNQTAEAGSRKWSKRALSSLLRTEFRLAARLFAPPPVSVFFFHKAFKAVWPELSQVLKEGSFDVVWFEHSLTYPFVRKIAAEMNRRPKLVCNAHNIESNLQERYADLAPTAAVADYWRLQGRLLRHLETEAFGACDLVVTCSQKDKEGGAKLAPRARFEVIGNGVDKDYFRPESRNLQASAPVLLFTGGFGYGPNLDGLRFFLRDILPLVRRKRPDCRFIFAGAKAQSAMGLLGELDAGIQCVSDPQDIRPCFHQATVFVVPLRVGGGTRLKILEAMAMERAIVSTSMGAEGIPCKDGEHLLLAETPNEFAEKVLRLLADEPFRSRIEKQAGAWVRQNYDWRLLCNKAMESLSALFCDNSGPAKQRV